MDNSTNGKRPKRPNGHGCIEQLKDGRWRARYTEYTGKGRRRKAFTGKSREIVETKLYGALGWWDEANHLASSGEASEHVYFMQGVNGGPVKIGTAADVKARLKQIQACSPDVLRVLHIIPGAGREIERKLHARFSPHRLHGEWFDTSVELMGYIRDLKETAKLTERENRKKRKRR